MPRFAPLPDRRPAIVACASAGIGEATAIDLASRGFPVALGARRVEKLDDIVTTLTTMSPLALKTVKRVLNTSYDTSLSAGFEVEGHAYEKLRESGDYKEGIAAFTEKRKPNFTGA